jgi:hypothetical protein
VTGRGSSAANSLFVTSFIDTHDRPNLHDIWPKKCIGNA